MSELRVDTINEATSGEGTTISKLTNPNEPFRNLIINGDMSIFQRATATTTVTSGQYSTADRYKFYESTDGAYTTELENLSFKTYYPFRHSTLVKYIDKARGNRKLLMTKIQSEVIKKLEFP